MDSASRWASGPMLPTSRQLSTFPSLFSSKTTYIFNLTLLSEGAST